MLSIDARSLCRHRTVEHEPPRPTLDVDCQQKAIFRPGEVGGTIMKAAVIREACQPITIEDVQIGKPGPRERSDGN